MDVLFFGPYGAMRDDATGLLPTFPIPVTYPQSAGFTLLPLEAPDYKAVVSLTRRCKHSHAAGVTHVFFSRLLEICGESHAAVAGVMHVFFKGSWKSARVLRNSQIALLLCYTSASWGCAWSRNAHLA